MSLCLQQFLPNDGDCLKQTAQGRQNGGAAFMGELLGPYCREASSSSVQQLLVSIILCLNSRTSHHQVHSCDEVCVIAPGVSSLKSPESSMLYGLS